MASRFIPNTSLSPDTNPKDVPYFLGQLSQTDSILFTKQSLVAFLKLHGVEVGPNLSEFSRLPRYATFGKLIEESTPIPSGQASPTGATTTLPAQTSASVQPVPSDFTPSSGVKDAEGNAFRPTRRVREHIGGGSAQISALFGDEEVSDRPLSPQASTPATAAAHTQRSSSSSFAGADARSLASNSTAQSFVPSTGVKDAEGNDFRPTRRVREPIGGGSQQIASLFGGDDDAENYAPRRSSSYSNSGGISKENLPRESVASISKSSQRGAFIVVEGLDRAGKSTQVARLESALANKNALVMKFPDRTTPIGKILNSYLSNPATELDDRAVHLLFAANRWEVARKIESAVERDGKIVIADRYTWSGVAYSRAKGMPLDWLLRPEIGLPSPDLTVFLSLSPQVAAQRGGYGEERYEKEEMQRKVREAFGEVEKLVLAAEPESLESRNRWTRIDAGGTQEEVWDHVWKVVSTAIQEAQSNSSPLRRMQF